MSDIALIKAQDKVLLFLMDSPKGRDDFWLDSKFKKKVDDERGIYPRKMLHMMLDADLLEKYKVKNRVRWRIIEGAFFRMDGKEYTWSYDKPKIVVSKPIDMYVEVGMQGNGIVEISVVDKPADPLCVMQEVENDDFPYLEKVKEALDTKPKKKRWFQKLKKVKL